MPSYFDVFGMPDMSVHMINRLHEWSISLAALSRALMAEPVTGTTPGTFIFRERGGGVCAIVNNQDHHHGLAGMNKSTRLWQAYEHSRLNRRFITPGSTCRCFHCLQSFAADRISQWTDNGETALCPHCGIDAVVSSEADQIPEELIRQLRATWFDAPTRKYTTSEWRAALANEQPLPSRA